jgi:hypothetical protein
VINKKRKRRGERTTALIERGSDVGKNSSKLNVGEIEVGQTHARGAFVALA